MDLADRPTVDFVTLHGDQKKMCTLDSLAVAIDFMGDVRDRSTNPSRPHVVYGNQRLSEVLKCRDHGLSQGPNQVADRGHRGSDRGPGRGLDVENFENFRFS